MLAFLISFVNSISVRPVAYHLNEKRNSEAARLCVLCPCVCNLSYLPIIYSLADGERRGDTFKHVKKKVFFWFIVAGDHHLVQVHRTSTCNQILAFLRKSK